MTVRNYQLSADWDNDGDFDSSYEDVTSYLLADPSLQVGYGRDTAQQAAPTTAGKLTFALDNRDKVFSPENTASALYGLVEPGVRVRLQNLSEQVTDNFDRTVTNGWGNTDTGQTWTTSSGASSSYSVSSSAGRHSLSSVASFRSTVLSGTRADVSVLTQVTVPAVATGAAIEGGVQFRYTDASNYYYARLRFETTQSVTLALVKNTTSGVIASTSLPSVTYTAGDSFWLEVEAYGTQLRTRAWKTTDTKPSYWQVTAVDTSHTAGQLRLRSMLATGNTNSLPQVVAYPSFETSADVLFDGVIDDLDVEYDHPARAFTADCMDAWGRPGAERLSTPLYQGIRTGTAIGLILDAIGWTGDRDLDAGSTVMPYWWAEDVDAATAVDDIINSEGPPAIAYVQGGTFVFRDRHHRVMRTTSTTVQATYAAGKPGTYPASYLKILKGAEYDRGTKNVVNAASFAVDVRQLGGLQQVWSSDDTYSIADGETITIQAQASDPFLNAAVPQDGVDFALVSGAVTVTLDRTSGQAVTISVHASGGPALINGMAVRGYPATVARTEKITAEDTTSVAKHGRRTWDRPAPYAGLDDVRVIAQHVVTRYATPQPTISVPIANINTAHTTQILTRRIGDRIRVIHDGIGMDREVWVERIDHDIRKLGALHRLTLGCQTAGPDQPDGVFTFDLAGAGFNDGVFGYAGVDQAGTVFTFDVADLGFDEGRFAH